MSKTIEMNDIIQALEYVRGAPVLTTNQCDDLARELNRAASIVGHDALSDEQLIDIARKAAVESTHRYNYMPALAEDAINWQPHRWVIEAMRSALLAAPVVERQEPVAYSYKEYVWATGLADYVWREKIEAELPNTEDCEIKDLVPLYTSPPAPVALLEPEQLFEALAGALGEALDCTRVWSAWGVGTMSEDDFARVADDQGRLHEIASACLDKLKEPNK